MTRGAGTRPRTNHAVRSRWAAFHNIGGRMRRAVVTGLGAVTPIGNDVPSTWRAALAGESGIDFIRSFDASGFPVRIAAEVKDFDPSDVASPREVRKLDRNVLLALGAAREAVDDARLDGFDPARVGIVFGSAIGGFIGIMEQSEVLRERGPERVSPNFLPNVLVDSASGQLAISLGIRGPNYAIVSACATGSHAIGEAAELAGRADLRGGARLRRLERRAPHGTAGPGVGWRRGDDACGPATLGGRACARGIHQRARNVDAARRRRGDEGDQGRVRAARVPDRRVLDEVGHGPLLRRRRRDRGDDVRPRNPRRQAPADDQLRAPRPGVRPRLRAQRGARGRGRRGALERDGPGRPQRLRPLRPRRRLARVGVLSRGRHASGRVAATATAAADAADVAPQSGSYDLRAQAATLLPEWLPPGPV